MDTTRWNEFVNEARELGLTKLHHLEVPTEARIEWTDMAVDGDDLKKGDLVLDRVKNETHRTVESVDRKDVWGVVTFVGGTTSRLRLDAKVNISRPVQNPEDEHLMGLQRALRDMLDELCKMKFEPITVDIVDAWRIYSDLESIAQKHAMFHGIVQPIIGNFANSNRDDKDGLTFLEALLHTVLDIETNLMRFSYVENSTNKFHNISSEVMGKVCADWLRGYVNYNFSSVQYHLREVFGTDNTKVILKAIELSKTEEV